MTFSRLNSIFIELIKDLAKIPLRNYFCLHIQNIDEREYLSNCPAQIRETARENLNFYSLEHEALAMRLTIMKAEGLLA
jgi:hypothetical protein